MTPSEALHRLRASMVTDIGTMDPDMVFGGYSKASIVEAMHRALSCAFVGPHFTVISVDVEFCVYFAGSKIEIFGVAPRRT